VTANYLLQLEPDRIPAGYRIRAGQEPRPGDTEAGTCLAKKGNMVF
jgi:hypothetical protein